MGEKPKKDKDRLRKQKILHPKDDKHKSQLEKEHTEHLSGGHELHSRIAQGGHAAYSEIDREKK